MMIKDIASESIYNVIAIYFDSEEVCVKNEQGQDDYLDFNKVELLNDSQTSDNLITELEIQLANWRERSVCLGKINCIVMHPTTWKSIYVIANLWESGEVEPKQMGHKLKYRGLKVFRSVDVGENEFKIY